MKSIVLAWRPALLTCTLLVLGCDGSEKNLVGPQDSIRAQAVAAGPQLAFTVQPVTTTAGAAIPSIQVTVQDAQGNTVTTFKGNVTIAIGTNPSGGTLNSSAPKKAVAGVATFTNLNIKKAGAGYTLVASAAPTFGFASGISAAFDITPAPASKLVFTVQPTSRAAGDTISPAVEVSARDAYDNTATTFVGNITVGLKSCSAGAVLSGTRMAAAVSGVAVFADLSVNKSGNCGLTAMSSSFTKNSLTFVVGPAAPAFLFFQTQPVQTKAGLTITPAVKVTARDRFGNTASGFNGAVTMTIGSGPVGAILYGTTSVTAVSGTASFATLSIQKIGQYTLHASADSLVDTISNGFTIKPNAPTHLAFTVQPSNAAPGALIAPPIEVTVRDAYDNTVPNAGSVTLAIGANPGSGTLSGTITKSASTGVAKFANLKINNAASGYTLVATLGNLQSATSAPFDIGSGNPLTQLEFTAQPSNTAPNAAIAPPIQVTAKDDQGDPVSSFNGNVTVSIGSNPSGGTLSGTLTVAAVAGVATFSDLSINNVGVGYTLQAISGGFTTTSISFAITTATQLAFTVQPSIAPSGEAISPAVEVTAQDAQGQTVTGFTGNVTISLDGNPVNGILSGTTTVAAIAGVARFSDLSIDRPASGYSLRSRVGSLNALSDAFTISAHSFVTVSGGEQSGCGLTATGKAYCWGDNTYGQVGDGTTIGRRVPVAVSGNLVFASISAGTLKACGVTTAGQAYCWGRNDVGELGNGGTANSSVPTAVLGGLTFSSVSASGQSFACGVTSSGAGYCWGFGAFYTLGTGNNSSSNQPVAVSGGLTFSSISAGAQHSCGVTTAGDAYCWGQNSLGQIGDGTTNTAHAPELVTGGYAFAAINAGNSFSCGVTTAGAAYCWGNDNFGQLGNGVTTDAGVATPSPAAVSGGLTFGSITAGSYVACGTNTSGAAYCWGDGSNGALGNGTFTGIQNTPVAVSGGFAYVSLSAGLGHVCGVTTGEETYCWGTNFGGELGIGNFDTRRNSPVAVKLP